jgi:hypothetical protein
VARAKTRSGRPAREAIRAASISRHRRIDLARPGVNAAGQALHIREAIALKILGCIHSPNAMMADQDYRGFPRPAPDDFLGQRLVNKPAPWNARDLEGLRAPHVQ